MHIFFLLLTSLPTTPLTLPNFCWDLPDNMSCVLGGSFVRGADNRRKDQRPRMVIHVDTFMMDTYEVTAGEYDACVRAGRCIYQKTNYPLFSGEDQPKVGISWFAARHYCRVHGKRLPTEAEWEKAARGPNGDLNPWGDAPATCALAVIKDDRGRGCGRKGFRAGKGRTWDVGSRPVGRYGLYDMIGNADEYVLDWHSESYALCGAACRGANPRGPCNGALRCPGFKERVVRGGSWYWGASHAYGSYRRGHYPTQKLLYHHFGFRCAKSVSSPLNLLVRIMNATVAPSIELSVLALRRLSEILQYRNYFN